MTAGFFTLLVVVGLLVYGDFGITWDEPGIHKYGNLLVDHYAPGGAWEDFWIFRFYGPVVAVLTAFVDRLTPSPAAGYRGSHLLYFFVFVGGVFAFYKLCSRQFASWRWGLFGAALLVASPRVFSHAFVNSKDTPLMTSFIVAVYLLVRYLETRRPKWLALCGVATAVAIDIRIVGVSLVALAPAAVLVDAACATEKRWRGAAGAVATYVATTVPATILLWPFLWQNPIGRLLETFRLMAFFNTGPPATLYLSEPVPVTETPWHYVPVWMGITTPIPYLVIAFVGLATIAGRVGRRRGASARSTERYFLVYTAWLVVPLLVIIGKNSALYDEWRQVQFLYPAFLMFAVAGAKWMYETAGSGWRRRPSGTSTSGSGNRPIQVVLVVAAAVSIGWTGYRMAGLHPYEGLYFNALVGEAGGAQGRFELDYWGLSYKEGLEFLLSTAPGIVRINQCFDGGPASANTQLFSKRDRERLRFVDAGEAEFGICAPARMPPDAYLPEYQTVFSVSRDGATFLFVKRLSNS
ncbi:MAG TPA: glycosyltransferase family 39 protein [Acidimicrobiales bacterium]|nr:glycosyltransferase family 39 protein [Acidimicrobiales bacterium]